MAGMRNRMTTLLEPLNLDADPENADWLKVSWDLPSYQTPAFLSFLRSSGQTLDEFRQLPVYRHAVRNGLIVRDRWMGTEHGYDGRGSQANFPRAVADLDRLFRDDLELFSDESAVSEVRRWLDGAEEQPGLQLLPWAGPGVTADEWFLITTLYVPMNLKGQRTLIRE